MKESIKEEMNGTFFLLGILYLLISTNNASFQKVPDIIQVNEV